MKKSIAVRNFLRSHAVAQLYEPGMEVQVLGTQPFRLATENADYEIPYSLEHEAKAIGLTGWNYGTQSTKWIGLDFDSITGHKAGLNSEVLREIRTKLASIPHITIRRSTGGHGYHVYCMVDCEVGSRSEHIALAQYIVHKLSALCGFDFSESVDCMGMVLWVWKQGQAENAFEIVKESTTILKVGKGWAQSSVLPRKYSYSSLSSYKHDALNLDSNHARLTEWLETNGCSWSWDGTFLVCHTYNLKQAHKELGLNGFFDTLASGRSGAVTGADHNCFAVPIEDGGWCVRRFGVGTKEHDSWEVDHRGYARTYLNIYLSGNHASHVVKGVEVAANRFYIPEPDRLSQALLLIGVDPGELSFGGTFEVKKGRAIIILDGVQEGWAPKGKDQSTRAFLLPSGVSRVHIPHNKIRHLVEEGIDAGWVVASDNGWVAEPRQNVKDMLATDGLPADVILGKCITNHWTIVNEPFKEEYPGRRKWNRDSAQFSIQPKAGLFPTWLSVFGHCGGSLDLTIQEHEWCSKNGINGGRDYLLYWVAWLCQNPTKPLPYLFFYGPQNSGKSTFHELLSMLFKKGKGYVRADRALTSSSGFNGELDHSVLCVVEETNLDNQDSVAYNRIKDWVTGRTISIRKMRQQAFDTRNTTHWVQCGNRITECPLIPGDTRITAIYVPPLRRVQSKDTLFREAESEMPGLLRHLLSTPLPLGTGRLNLPVIDTGEKLDQAETKLNDVERFINDYCFPIDGEAIPFKEFYERIRAHTDMSKIMVGRSLPFGVVKGTMGSAGETFIGNLSFNPVTPTKSRLERVGRMLKHG